MKNNKFTPRHNKLIKLKDNIDILKLGETNREYLQMIGELRAQVVKELMIEQEKMGILPKQKREIGQ